MNYQSFGFTVSLRVDGVSDSITIDFKNRIKLIGVLPAAPAVVLSVTPISGGQTYTSSLTGTKVTVTTSDTSPIANNGGLVITLGF